jgi:integrase
VRIHDLRHTYASLAISNGVPAEVASEKLGHTQVAFTLKQYRHVLEHEHKGYALPLTDLLRERNIPKA